MSSRSSKRVPFKAVFKQGKRKKSAGVRSGEYGGWSTTMTPRWAKIWHTNRSVSRRVVVQQHPRSSHVHVWPNATDALQQSFQNLLVEGGGTNELTRRNKFLVNDDIVVEKGDRHDRHFGFLKPTLWRSWRRRWTSGHRLALGFQVGLVAPGSIPSEDGG